MNFPRPLILLMAGAFLGGMLFPPVAHAVKEESPRLEHKLILRTLQGGFAGFSGQHLEIESDGSWGRFAVVAGEKVGPHEQGQLSEENLATLKKVLLAEKLDNLSENVGGPGMVNPAVIEVKYGSKSIRYFLTGGEKPPKPDATSDKPLQRFLRVVQAIQRLTSQEKGKSAG